jgi:hypothetical protein
MKPIKTFLSPPALVLLVLAGCFATVFESFGQEKDHGVNIGLVYPLSTHGTIAGEYSNIFSLNAIAGVSREERGFTAAGFSNFIKEDAHGFQVAGFSNHIGGFASGFKAAGFLNFYQGGRGFQVAGFANFAKANVRGFQGAGFMNTSAELRGFQTAGFMNRAGNVTGAQSAGYINIAGDVTGAQLSGFLNIAKKVSGVQIAGFINIADSSDYPIGIINIVRNGEKQIGLTTDDNLTTLLTFRSGGRVMYGIIGLGFNLQNKKDVFARQFGIGAHMIRKENFRINTEATVISLENFRKGDFAKFSLSVLPAFRFGNFEVFGGPAINVINTDSEDGRTLIPHYIWSNDTGRARLNGVYIGYTAGIQMSL